MVIQIVIRKVTPVKKTFPLLLSAVFVFLGADRAFCMTIGEIAAASALVSLVVDPGIITRSILGNSCPPGGNPAGCHADEGETVPALVKYPSTGDAFQPGAGINRTPIPSAYDRHPLP